MVKYKCRLFSLLANMSFPPVHVLCLLQVRGKWARGRGSIQSRQREWAVTVQHWWKLKERISTLQPCRTERSNRAEGTPEMNAGEQGTWGQQDGSLGEKCWSKRSSGEGRAQYSQWTWITACNDESGSQLQPFGFFRSGEVIGKFLLQHRWILLFGLWGLMLKALSLLQLLRSHWFYVRVNVQVRIRTQGRRWGGGRNLQNGRNRGYRWSWGKAGGQVWQRCRSFRDS